MFNRATVLVAAVVMAATTAFACGPSKPPEQPEPGPGTEPTGEPKPSSEPGTEPGPKTGPEPGPEPGPTPTPSPKGAEAVPLSATKMAEDLKKLGINLKSVPELQKVPLATKKKLMPLFVKSLGYENCQGCHASESDFKTDTKNMKIARNMWNHFVRDLRDAKGGTLFCDSCHSGKQHLLPRGDKDAIQEFMKVEYEAKLSRADGAEHSCSSCHSDVFEPKIMEKLWGVK